VAVSSQAWADPGAHPVVPGVHRLPLPLPGDGLRAVNVYAVEDGDGIVLVDSGWHRTDSWAALNSGLREIGAAVGDVRQVIATHMHHDHYGQAAHLRRESGAVVVLGRGEKRSLDVILQPSHGEMRAHEQARMIRDGAEELAAEVAAVEKALAPETRRGHAIWELPDVWAADGALIELADRVLEPIETPGHTRGHITLFDRERGLLFAGDHVLPHITPSLGLEIMSDGLPLVDFLLSLMKVRDLPARAVLPAHGHVFDDLRARVEELLDHHATRLAAAREAVRGRERTAYEVAHDLPWTRRQKRFDELDLFNRVLAVHETGAHLDLLAVQGTLTAHDEAGVRHYRVAPGA
jgi:glyoxylase-like metal-dependent hydrolase (beta-lactamase superfamily II)